MNRHFFAVALASVAQAMLAGAADPPFSLDALASEALARNSELKSFEAGVAAAKGQRSQAGYFKNPEVSFEVGAREVRDSENVLQGNGSTFGFSVLQTFEFPGKGSLRKAIADKNVEIAELGLAQFRLALAGKVRLLALEHAAASAEAAAAEEVFSRSRALAAEIASRETFGARQRLETGLVRASLAGLGANIKNAALRREETLRRLNALLGRRQNLPIKIAAPAEPPHKKIDESALVFAVQNNNPLLKIRRKELERSARELSAARLDVAPDFAIGPFFSRDTAGDTEQNIGASISATLPLWDWNAGNIRTAKARSDSARAQRVQAELDAESQALGLLAAHRLALRQIASLPSVLASEARDIAASAEVQFRNGSIGAQLYLDAQAAYLDSVRISQEARLDAWRTLLDIDLLAGGSAPTPPKP